MFDLEQAINDWRRQMRAAGIKSPVPLEELESHLRDDMEQQMQSGTNPQLAFENSVRRLGGASQVKGEFKKICGMNRGAWLRLGSIGLPVTLLLNLAGLLVFHRSSSVFFSHQWWSDWFTNYAIWIVCLIMGLVTRLAGRRIPTAEH